MASPVESEKMQQGSSRSALYREPLKLTLNDVYELGKSIAQDIQRASSSTKGSDDLLKGIVERVLRALEWLETYVEEAEELRSTNYRLMLKADELTREKSRRNALEQELKGMQLVAEERGRQRDTLGIRVSELEAQNAYYQQRLETIEQNKALSARRQKYSSTTLLETDEGDDAQSSASNNTTQSDYLARSKSLDRREMRLIKGHSSASKIKDKAFIITQLQKELGHEKKKMTELKESHSLEQRRVKQRVNHMEQEIVTLKKQLHSAQQLIDKLNEEKIALMERSEVLTEVKAITLATVARGTLVQHNNGDRSFEDTGEPSAPKFYKKDLMMILQDRNELKEKVANLQEEITSLKRRLEQYEVVTPIHSRGHSPATTPRRSRTATPISVTERLVDSMIVLDVANHLSPPIHNCHTLPGRIHSSSSSYSISSKISSLENNSPDHFTSSGGGERRERGGGEKGGRGGGGGYANPKSDEGSPEKMSEHDKIPSIELSTSL